jgi:hypothetical protein
VIALGVLDLWMILSLVLVILGLRIKLNWHFPRKMICLLGMIFILFRVEKNCNLNLY